jgi:hypothetical protein
MTPRLSRTQAYPNYGLPTLQSNGPFYVSPFSGCMRTSPPAVDQALDVRRKTLYVRLSMPLTTVPTTIFLSRILSPGSHLSPPPFRGPTIGPELSRARRGKVHVLQDRPAGFTPESFAYTSITHVSPSVAGPEVRKLSYSFLHFTYVIPRRWVRFGASSVQNAGPFRGWRLRTTERKVAVHRMPTALTFRPKRHYWAGVAC